MEDRSIRGEVVRPTGPSPLELQEELYRRERDNLDIEEKEVTTVTSGMLAMRFRTPKKAKESGIPFGKLREFVHEAELQGVADDDLVDHQHNRTVIGKKADGYGGSKEIYGMEHVLAVRIDATPTFGGTRPAPKRRKTPAWKLGLKGAGWTAGGIGAVGVAGFAWQALHYFLSLFPGF